MKATLYMMVGLPGSGKSTKAKELSRETGAIVHASDKLREELFDDENSQIDNQKLFQELHNRIKNDLKHGVSVIYDATNLNSKKRAAFLREIKNIECNKSCVIVATPYEECLKNNRARGRVVPEEVIKRMYMNWNTPFWYEGWDDIKIEYKNEMNFSCSLEFAETFFHYDQKNNYHQFSLGRHLLKAQSNVSTNFDKYTHGYWEPLVDAALLHDCGKPFVKSFINKDGEKGEEAHYYNHEKVGAYDSLFFKDKAYSNDENEETKWILNRAILIEKHMRPLTAWKHSEKAKEKDRKLFGDELFDELLLLHEADVAAHY